MKRQLFYLLVPLILISCSKYNIRTEMENKSDLSQLKSSGLIYRMSRTGIFDRGSVESVIKLWFRGHKKINNIKVISSADDRIGVYNSIYDRFFQPSVSNGLLKYKTIGVIKLFLRSNEDELKKIIDDNKLDSIIIYEVKSNFSPELQIFDFNSILVIADKDLNIIYLDYQKDSYPEDKTNWDTILYGDVKGDYDKYNMNMLKKLLLDKISERLIETLKDLDYIDEPDE